MFFVSLVMTFTSLIVATSFSTSVDMCTFPRCMRSNILPPPTHAETGFKQTVDEVSK